MLNRLKTIIQDIRVRNAIRHEERIKLKFIDLDKEIYYAEEDCKSLQYKINNPELPMGISAEVYREYYQRQLRTATKHLATLHKEYDALLEKHPHMDEEDIY